MRESECVYSSANCSQFITFNLVSNIPFVLRKKTRACLLPLNVYFVIDERNSEPRIFLPRLALESVTGKREIKKVSGP